MTQTQGQLLERIADALDTSNIAEDGAGQYGIQEALDLIAFELGGREGGLDRLTQQVKRMADVLETIQIAAAKEGEQ